HKISYSLTSTNTGWSQSNSNCGLRIVRIRRTREADMHDHDHEHQAHAPITDAQELTYYEKRVYAIQSLLVEKGVITADEVRRAVEDMDARTPALGAKVVARAWVDPAFKACLLADAKAAVAELGIDIGS